MFNQILDKSFQKYGLTLDLNISRKYVSAYHFVNGNPCEFEVIFPVTTHTDVQFQLDINKNRYDVSLPVFYPEPVNYKQYCVEGFLPALYKIITITDSKNVNIPVGIVYKHRVTMFFDWDTLYNQMQDTINGKKDYNVICEQVCNQICKYWKHCYDTWYQDELKTRFVNFRERLITEKQSSAKKELGEVNIEISNKISTIKFLQNKREKLNFQLVGLMDKTSKMREKSIDGVYTTLKRLVPKSYKSIIYDVDKLIACTHEIHFDDVYLGYYRITISAGGIEIINLDDSILTMENVRGYHHPHVDTNGIPCWGNIIDDIDSLQRNLEFAGLLILISDFLNSYTPNDAYVKLEAYDSNYVDEDKYEECRENTSVSDCINCGDSECPYWDERFQRCWESVDGYATCINCAGCDYCKEAENLCCDDAEPSYCVNECTTTNCGFQDNPEDACGYECESCGSSFSCEYNENIEEE